jgi:hypothetical protein
MPLEAVFPSDAALVVDPFYAELSDCVNARVFLPHHEPDAANSVGGGCDVRRTQQLRLNSLGHGNPRIHLEKSRETQAERPWPPPTNVTAIPTTLEIDTPLLTLCPQRMLHNEWS